MESSAAKIGERRRAPRGTALRVAYDRFALGVLTITWAALAFGVFTGEVSIPGGRMTIVAYPVALTAIWLFAGGAYEREQRFAAGSAWAVVLALFTASAVPGDSRLALAAPGALVAGFLVYRYPTAAVGATILLSGVLGTIQAFTGVNAAPLLDVALGGLLVVVGLRALRGAESRSRPATVLAAGSVLLLAYLAITVVQLLADEAPQVAVEGFRASTWYLGGVLSIAWAGWDLRTHDRIARAAVAIAGLIAAYATFRWFVPVTGTEYDYAVETSAAINVLDGELRVIGSFETGHQLAMWTGSLAPFALAMAFAWRSWWRILALATTGLCAVAMLASEARAPLVGMILGMLLVVGLAAASRTIPTRPTLVVGGVASVAAGIAIALAAGADLGTRYDRIFSPGDDPAFQSRQSKWEAALDELEGKPFGNGIGTGNASIASAQRYLNVARLNLDNSYLKVAYEQGLLIGGLFAAALIALLAGACRGAVAAASRTVSALGIGAAGALLALMFTLFFGPYIEVPPVAGLWLVIGLGMAQLAVPRADRPDAA